MDFLFPTASPLDPKLNSSTFSIGETLAKSPYPPYPAYPSFRKLISETIYQASLSPNLVFSFCLFYLVLGQIANQKLITSKNTTDLTRRYAWLNWLIISHNLALAAYSAWTFAKMLPDVLDFFAQGWTLAGWKGIKLSLCSMPTNQSTSLGFFSYLFYLSKYYEVIDSLILFLKGKKIGLLQRYHHTGALIAMWIAVRFRSQPVWVFCLFNSFVHTLMYSYYFCSAVKIPFPRALKRNLTTLQIAQIASGTILTNLYFFTTLDPSSILKSASPSQLSSSGQWLSSTFFSDSPAAVPFTRLRNLGKEAPLLAYASQRANSQDPQTCLQTTGAKLALYVNTLYMLPLLALFAQFFVSSYLSSTPPRKTSSKSKPKTLSNGSANGIKQE